MLRKVGAGLGVALFLAIAGIWLCVPRGWRWRRCLAVMAWRCLLPAFGIRVEVHGTPLPEAGTLYVANHVSWTDIPVLGLVLNAGFVAKGDIRGWPVIGKLTEAYGCLFVERERRGKAQDQAAALASHLEADRGLVLFPEGTTGLGIETLPFRSSLFALVPGVADGSAKVQPVTLRYLRADSLPLTEAEQRQIAWIGDDELLPHAAGLLKGPKLVAQVWFEQPVLAADRKALARACEAAVTERLKA